MKKIYTKNYMKFQKEARGYRTDYNSNPGFQEKKVLGPSSIFNNNKEMESRDEIKEKWKKKKKKNKKKVPTKKIYQLGIEVPSVKE